MPFHSNKSCKILQNRNNCVLAHIIRFLCKRSFYVKKEKYSEITNVRHTAHSPITPPSILSSNLVLNCGSMYTYRKSTCLTIIKYSSKITSWIQTVIWITTEFYSSVFCVILNISQKFNKFSHIAFGSFCIQTERQNDKIIGFS